MRTNGNWVLWLLSALMLLLLLSYNVQAHNAAVRSPEAECDRGCDTNTGECWRLLAEVHTGGLLSSPTLMFIGEPYPTEHAASCGAKKLRAYGACVAIGLPGYNYNVPVGRIAFTKDDLPYPGTDDCYN